MVRKGWSTLKADYRARLERAGITQADYESGQSLKKGRGHANTPERPSQYSKSQYPSYSQERTRLERALTAKKQRLWGDKPRWNPARSERYIREKPPSLRLLRWALDATEQELIDEIRESPEAYSFIGYH